MRITETVAAVASHSCFTERERAKRAFAYACLRVFVCVGTAFALPAVFVSYFALILIQHCAYHLLA